MNTSIALRVLGNVQSRAIEDVSPYSRFQTHHGLPILVLLLPEPEAERDHELDEPSEYSLLA